MKLLSSQTTALTTLSKKKLTYTTYHKKQEDTTRNRQGNNSFKWYKQVGTACSTSSTLRVILCYTVLSLIFLINLVSESFTLCTWRKRTNQINILYFTLDFIPSSIAHVHGTYIHQLRSRNVLGPLATARRGPARAARCGAGRPLRLGGQLGWDLQIQLNKDKSEQNYLNRKT